MKLYNFLCLENIFLGRDHMNVQCHSSHVFDESIHSLLGNLILSSVGLSPLSFSLDSLALF